MAQFHNNLNSTFVADNMGVVHGNLTSKLDDDIDDMNGVSLTIS